MPGPTTRSLPDVAIKLNGQEVPPLVYQDLLEVGVEEHVDGPSAFTLRLSAEGKGPLDSGWADEELFVIGGEVEILLGYSGALQPLMFGDVIGLTLNVQAGEPPELVVRGYDRRHRMLRGTRTRTFVKMKDSDIAARIAQEQGLTANVVDSQLQHEHVSQEHQSDLDFLAQRARLIGYEVHMEGRTLHFRPGQHAARASLTLQAEQDLLELSVRMSAGNQPSEVVVRGWDPLNREVIIGRASKGQESSMGTRGGPQVAHQAFGDSVLTLAQLTVSSREEADRIAREQLERMALGFLQGDGRCLGRTDLRAGLVVEVQGVGRRFSGKYYITSATHSYTPERGYRTSFSVRRNST